MKKQPEKMSNNQLIEFAMKLQKNIITKPECIGYRKQSDNSPAKWDRQKSWQFENRKQAGLH